MKIVNPHPSWQNYWNYYCGLRMSWTRRKWNTPKWQTSARGRLKSPSKMCADGHQKNLSTAQYTFISVCDWNIFTTVQHSIQIFQWTSNLKGEKSLLNAAKTALKGAVSLWKSDLGYALEYIFKKTIKQDRKNSIFKNTELKLSNWLLMPSLVASELIWSYIGNCSVLLSPVWNVYIEQWIFSTFKL